ncbi:hypothetical protein LINPERHAP2_LOCUS22198 [Linum perenne]
MSNVLRFVRVDKSGNLVIEVQSVMLSDLKASNLSTLMTSANCVHSLIVSLCSFLQPDKSDNFLIDVQPDIISPVRDSSLPNPIISVNLVHPRISSSLRFVRVDKSGNLVIEVQFVTKNESYRPNPSNPQFVGSVQSCIINTCFSNCFIWALGLYM